MAGPAELGNPVTASTLNGQPLVQRFSDPYLGEIVALRASTGTAGEGPRGAACCLARSTALGPHRSATVRRRWDGSQTRPR